LAKFVPPSAAPPEQAANGLTAPDAWTGLVAVTGAAWALAAAAESATPASNNVPNILARISTSFDVMPLRSGQTGIQSPPWRPHRQDVRGIDIASWATGRSAA
jgi:hypothetical protein